MPWYNQKTWADDDPIDIPSLNAYLRDDLNWLSVEKPRIRAFSTYLQVVRSASPSTVVFDYHYHAQNVIHPILPETNGSETFTVPTACEGFYAIGAQISWLPNSLGERSVQILLNGTTVLAEKSQQACATLPTHQSISTAYQLIPGQRLQVVAWQNSGNDLTLAAWGNHAPQFWMYQVSPG